MIGTLAGMVLGFAKAIGETDPVYSDEAAAKAAVSDASATPEGEETVLTAPPVTTTDAAEAPTELTVEPDADADDLDDAAE